MKKCILALATALALVTSNAAADGLVTKGQIKDHSQADAPFSWRGFYFGVHAGLATGTAETNSDFIYNADTNLTGALYGVHAGYNWQRDSLVLGIEGAWSGSNIQGSDVCALGRRTTTVCEREVDSLATVVGRAGWAMNHTLLYGFGGLAWGDVNPKGVNNYLTVTGSETQFGWIAGFGLEHAVSDRISFKIEYARIDLGSDTFSLGGYDHEQYSSIKAKIDTQLDTIRLGVNVKLGHGH